MIQNNTLISQKKLLVCGARGFIGSEIMHRFHSYNPIGTTSKPVENNFQYLTLDLKEKGFKSVLQNINKAASISQLTHAVVATMPYSVDQCFLEREESWLANVDNTKMLIDWLVEQRIQPIFLSSDYVFDGRRGHYSERDHTTPHSQYGKQKLAVEKYIKCQTDNYLILRLGKVVSEKLPSLLTDFVTKIIKNETVNLATDQVLGLVHLDDVIFSLRGLLEKNISGTYHIANGQSVKRHEIYNEIFTKMHQCDNRLLNNAKYVELKDIAFVEPRPQNTSMTNKKIQRSLNQNFLSNDEMFQMAVDYYFENRKQ